jgi:cupin 2 domain-containing protein
MLVRNLFANLPIQSSIEQFDELAQGGKFRLSRIVSMGQSTPPGEWYDQSEDEWVVLLQGSAVLRFEEPSCQLELSPGDYVLILAHRRHRVETTDLDLPSVWLALHFSAEAV